VHTSALTFAKTPSAAAFCHQGKILESHLTAELCIQSDYSADSSDTLPVNGCLHIARSLKMARPQVVRYFEMDAVLLLRHFDRLFPLPACLVHLVEQVVAPAPHV